MPRTPLPPPEMGRPGRRPPCPGSAGRPLPDPAAVRLCTVPHTAPPYDDEVLPGPPCGPGNTASPARASAAGGDPPGQAAGSGTAELSTGPGSTRDGGETAAQGTAGRGAQPPAPPGQFAQVLIETLTGQRPPRQLATWTTQRARNRIQCLGPVLSAGQRPRLRRVIAFRPSPDVIEMTLVLSCGARTRALAVRLEQLTPRHASIGQRARPARWCCTEVEAA